MQKFIISSSVLKPVLQKLGQAINQKTVLPVLKNIFFKVSKDSAELITSDLELTIIHKCECQLEGEPLELLLPFDIISHIVSFNPASPLTFSVEKKGVKVTGANDVYDIKKLNENKDFPKLPEMPTESMIPLTNLVLSALKTSLLTTGSDVYNGVPAPFARVLMELKEETITVVSSDANALFTMAVKSFGSKTTKEVQLSAKLIKALLGASMLKLGMTDNNAVFKNDDFTLFYRQPEQKYVAWRKVIPADAPANLELNRLEVIGALEKCNMSGDELRNMKVTLGKKNIRFSAKDNTVGLAINVDVAGSYEGDTDSIVLLSDELLKLMHQASGETVSLAIHGSSKQVLIRCKDEEGYLGMIMPVAEKE